ncbi:hypothetical protein NEOLI_004090, partial [Neolecta irregularis DAH-3]
LVISNNGLLCPSCTFRQPQIFGLFFSGTQPSYLGSANFDRPREICAVPHHIMPLQSSLRSRIHNISIREFLRSASTLPLITSDSSNLPSSVRIRQLLETIKKSRVPVEIYKTRPVKKTLLLFYSLAVVQLAFWGNIAQWSFSEWTEEIKATGEKVRANIVKRAIIGSVLLGIGIGFSYAFIFYPSRLITSLKILPGMHKVQLTTAGFYPLNRGSKILTFPIADLAPAQRLFSGKGTYGTKTTMMSPFVTMRNKKLGGSYLIDTNGYFSGGGKLFDTVFPGLASNIAKK